MRTLRELGGWGLLFVVQLTPLVVLGLLVAFFDDDDSTWALFSALLLALLWPRMLLSARRLREPPHEEIAEADGRRPVLVLHRFMRVAAPLAARSLFVQPGLFRDFRDARRERAIAKTLSAVGPILPLARPAPPPAHGPVSLQDDSAWRLELDRHLRRASMAVIVLDGTEANAIEIERAAALLGLSRTILVIPPELPAAAYAQLRARLPLLPELDRRARAIRFGAEDRPFFMESVLVHPSEAMPQPKPPTGTWLLAVLAVFAGLYSAISTPLLLDDRLHESDEVWVWGGLFAVGLGIVLAGLSRRAVRLVPANEAVMVTVAALPWLFTEIVGGLVALESTDGYSMRNVLEKGAIGAAYSAPLLAAAAIILAVSSLVRHAPGRQRAFATFGAAALLPLWPLAMSLDAMGVDVSDLVLGIFAGALGLGLAAWSASGEPARANAPLPIGAAIAGALSVAAFFVVTSHSEWAGFLEWDFAAREAARDRMSALSSFGSAWPWFALAGPAVIVLVAMQFSRRASRVAIASLAAFVPFVVLCTLASASEARARAHVDGSLVGNGIDAATEGLALAPAFELPELRVWDGRPAGPADIVLDSTGLVAGGERLASLDELALAGSYGAPPAVTRTLYGIAAARGGDAPRVAVRRDMDVSHLLRVLRAARRAGFDQVELLGVAPDGGARSVRMATGATPEGAESLRLYVLAQPYAIVLVDRSGMRIEIPHVGGAIDEARLRQMLRERRQMIPNEYEVSLVTQTYPGTAEAMRVGAILVEEFGRVALVERAPF